MKRILLLLILTQTFFIADSDAQKTEFGINLGIADASIRSGDQRLRKSVMGYNAGLYVEQYVMEDVGFNSSIQFIEKGARGSSTENNNYAARLDYIQYAFTVKGYIDEGNKNKLVIGLGFYFGLLNHKKISPDPTVNAGYQYSFFDIGINGLLGIKIDKYVALFIQAQISPAPVISNPVNAGHYVYAGLNLSAPIFSCDK